jgi:adenine-specific DNA-methyltransferase
MAVGYGVAKGLRQNSTDAERLLWLRVRNRQIADAKFRRQQPIGPYVVDLVCMEQKLVIELDGGQHADQVAEDAARTAYPESRGFRVLRFWNNQVIAEAEAVLQSIYEALAQAAGRAVSVPSPLAGEG